MLVAKHLSKSFGPIRAVDDVCLQLNKGEIVGFLGPNGAGKSTIIRMLAGVLRPDQGQIEISEIKSSQNSAIRQNRPGYLPEGAPLYPELTPRQTFSFFLQLNGFSRSKAKARIDELLQQLDLRVHADTQIQHLSKGFARRTALALALATDPDILLLDEPFDGFDPIQKRAGRKLLRAQANQKAILVCTHSLSEAQALCDRVLILNQGKLIASGDIPSILQQSGENNFEAAFCQLIAGQT